MSKENTPELTKSWVVVDSENRVQELQDVQPQGDSDSDSISVISDSAGSYKTDEEEVTTPEANETIVENKEEEFSLLEEPQIDECSSTDIVEQRPPENDKTELFLYFATSAICALIIIGFSVAVQQYFQGTSNINLHESEAFPGKTEEFIHSEFSDNVKTKRRNKNQENVEDNDLCAETSFKSNYKPSKNKVLDAKCTKENCDVKTDQKIQELKIKEEYLREKEKFLIEKEHNLLKKELKLKKNDRQEKVKEKYDDKENFKKTKYKDKKKWISDDKREISGQWYSNLHEGRDTLRQKKRFSIRKNRAHWYFQWMVDRARLRVK